MGLRFWLSLSRGGASSSSLSLEIWGSEPKGRKKNGAFVSLSISSSLDNFIIAAVIKTDYIGLISLLRESIKRVKATEGIQYKHITASECLLFIGWRKKRREKKGIVIFYIASQLKRRGYIMYIYIASHN